MDVQTEQTNNPITEADPRSPHQEPDEGPASMEPCSEGQDRGPAPEVSGGPAATDGAGGDEKQEDAPDAAPADAGTSEAVRSEGEDDPVKAPDPAAEATADMNADRHDADPAPLRPPEEPDLPVHDACQVLPMMAVADLEHLAKDIQKNGLLHPIVLYEDQILHEDQIVDGRNRYVACRMAGVEPRFVQWRDLYQGSMTIYDWIWSLNVERRQLSADQRVTILAGLTAVSERDAARQRQIEAGRQQGDHGKEGGRGNAKPLPANSPEGVSDPPAMPPTKPKKRDRSGETPRRLAQKAGVSEHKAKQALKVIKEDPKLAREVGDGKATLRQAAKQIEGKQAGASVRAPREKHAKNNRKGKSGKVTAKVADAVNTIMGRIDAAIQKFEGEDRKVFLREVRASLKARK
jgi:hypothetical protein